jgi:tellurite resistance protein TerC
VAFFALDWAVLQVLPNALGWHVALVGFWIAVALAFNVLIWVRFGSEEAVNWAMGYGIEWMLSLDNLMLIQMIFLLLRTPPADFPKAMIIGVICSVVVRLLFYLVILWLIDHVGWVRYPCAAMLIWSGIQGAVYQDDDDVALEDLLVVRGIKLLVGDRLAGSYTADGSVFVRDATSGRFQATLLMVAILMIMWIDTVFSLDSVAVKVSMITNGYVAFSSSVLAMFGLRAMFFVITSMMKMFGLLQYGLCVILLFVALEMLLSPWFDITPSSTFLVMASVFAVSIAASVLKNGREESDKAEQAQHEQPQEAPDCGQPQEPH